MSLRLCTSQAIRLRTNLEAVIKAFCPNPVEGKLDNTL